MDSGIAAADLVACRGMLRAGSRSFFAAGLLLPRRVMVPATALYAFCRVADDLIDEGGGAAALEVLHRRLDGVYAGVPWDFAADRALAAVVGRHRLPRALLDGLLEGFAWDAVGRAYEELGELEAYAARVAGTVGAAMAVLMGVRAPGVVARACDLGVAMQLSNIARDVGEDARAGRLYLPRRWMREAGVDPEAFLAAPRFSAGLGQVVGRVVAAADVLYARADAGIAALPLDCRPGIGAARRLYSAIGHGVMAGGGNSVDGRVVVGTGRKLGLLGRAMGSAFVPGGAVGGGALLGAPLPAVRHLVAAVAMTSGGEAAREAARGGLVRLIELFDALNMREAGASVARDSA